MDSFTGSLKFPNYNKLTFHYDETTTILDIRNVLTENGLVTSPMFFANGKNILKNVTIKDMNLDGPISILEEQDHTMFFQYLTGLRLSISVSRNTTFAEVRDMLVHIGKSPNFRFILCGQVVDDTETMESVNVFVNPVVHIV